MMNWMLRSCARALTVAALLTAVVVVTAQAQTPEGTVITNTAEVSWTDANGNAYAPVSGSVNVTVGFQAGIDATPDGATVTPASPSTNDTLTFYVKNSGNGVDTVSVTEDLGASPAVISVQGYVLGGTPQATLAALNAALATTQIAAGDSVEIQVVYNVPGDQGGQITVYTLTATSFRDNSDSNDATISVQPPAAYAVQVTPNPAPDRQQIPGTYTVTFTVENTGNITEDFDLNASNQGLPQNFLTIVSVDGVAGSSTQINLIPAGTQAVDVVYTINGAAVAGAIDSLSFVASSATQPATLDESKMQVEVLRAVVTISKAVFEADRVTPLAGTVVPGQVIWYRITVTNSGIVDAETIHVDDNLPVEVTFLSTLPDAAGWTITNSGNDVDADLAGTLAPAASRVFWIEVQIN
jgi:uncharacterized repeat protein (TIGR01451 family)